MKCCRNNFGWLWLGILILVSGFAWCYVGREDRIYQWDLALYWKRYQFYFFEVFENPRNAVRFFVQNLRGNIYTDLGTVTLLPLGWLLGADRAGYITAIAATMLVPAIWSAHRFFARILFQEMNPVQRVGLIAMLLLFTPWWRPVLLGYVGVGGMVLCFGVLGLTLRSLPESWRWQELFLMAGLLCLLALFRRWYLFWIVGYFLACGGVFLLPLLWRRQGALLWKRTVRFVAIGLLLISGYAIVAWPTLMRLLEGNASQGFKAYQISTSLLGFFHFWHMQFGGGLLVLILLGLGVGLCMRRYRTITLFTGIQMLVATALFFRTQDFAEHHYFIMVPSCLIFLGVLVHQLFRWSSWGAGLTLFFLGLQFLAVFEPMAKVPNPHGLFPTMRQFPVVQEHKKGVEGVLRFLVDQIGEDPEPQIYVVASSFSLSDNVLRDAHLVLDLPVDLRNQIVSTGHVDINNGFPVGLLEAEWVVVGDPVQIHLGEEEQQIVVLPARDFLSGVGLALAFERQAVMALKPGLEVHLFRKVSPIPLEAVKQLEQALIKAHPDHVDKMKAPIYEK